MLRLVIAIFVAFAIRTATAAPVATSCARLAQIITTSIGEERQFALRNVKCQCEITNSLHVRDANAAVTVVCVPELDASSVRNGDWIDISGYITVSHWEERTAHVTKLRVVRHDQPDLPRSVSGSEFNSPTNDFRLVRLTGIVKDAREDEIDRRYAHFVVWDRGIEFSASINHDMLGTNSLSSLVGASVDFVGFCYPRLFGTRKHLGRSLQVRSLKVGGHMREMESALPRIERICNGSPAELACAGPHCAAGRVLAVWNDGASFLLRTDTGNPVQIDGLRLPPPHVGDSVVAIGFPVSNTHYINLTHAEWSPQLSDKSAFTNEPCISISANDIMGSCRDKPQITPGFHGRRIQLKGTIRKTYGNGALRQMIIENCDYLISVDMSSLPKSGESFAVGGSVAVTGICIMEIENQSSITVFPRIKGFFLVPQYTADVVMVSRPSWLTTEKLLVLLGFLIAILVAVLFWNLSLRSLAARRGRELFRSQVAKITSELRIKERTRLAVELHDSLAQNLTGVSMEIEAAERSRKEGMDAVSRHLFIADKALKSCRNELRNSLWDLRSQALEEPDLEKAIRRTLLPHVKGVSLAVRFNALRSRFTDNTLHEVLRIIRELTLNGIRHGGATEIRIAGAIDGEQLKFSVSDNGGGFDPNDHPGVSGGHFGLQGIAERLDAYSGEISFSSNPEKGTKTVVTIPLTKQKEPEK